MLPVSPVSLPYIDGARGQSVCGAKYVTADQPTVFFITTLIGNSTVDSLPV